MEGICDHAQGISSVDIGGGQIVPDSLQLFGAQAKGACSSGDGEC